MIESSCTFISGKRDSSVKYNSHLRDMCMFHLVGWILTVLALNGVSNVVKTMLSISVFPSYSLPLSAYSQSMPSTEY